jgi:hypothetical protein
MGEIQDVPPELSTLDQQTPFVGQPSNPLMRCNFHAPKFVQ